MSLINDALKRASSSKPPPPPSGEAPASGPPLQPVHDTPPPRIGIIPAALFAVGVGALALAGGLWLKAKGTVNQQPQQSAQQGSVNLGPIPDLLSASSISRTPSGAPTAAQQPTRASIEASAANRDNPSQSPGLTKAAAAQPQPSLVTQAPAESAPRPLSAPITKVSGQTPAASVPEKSLPVVHAEPEELKLQAIYYRLKGPTVVINGKTLRVGQTIGGAKLIDINRNSVELEQGGRYITLVMEQ